MLEPISANFIILCLIFLITKRYKLSLFFIFLTSILRPEFLFVLIFLIFHFRTYLIGLIFSSLVFSIQLFIFIRCKTDQSNFIKWQARGYYEHIKHMDWQRAKEDMAKRGGFLKVLAEDYKENPGQVLSYTFKNIITNPIKLLLFPIVDYKRYVKYRIFFENFNLSFKISL